MVELHWANEYWVALPERALWWPRRRTLFVADLHLGKPAAFRAFGIPVPEAATDADLTRLDHLIERWSPQRLVVLGDLLHAKHGRCPQTLERVYQWRQSRVTFDWLIVRGNHDRRAGDPPASWGCRVVNECTPQDGDDEIVFGHDPAVCEARSQRGATLCGHIHPAVRLSNAVFSHRVACFWFRKDPPIGILPAFGSFTGTHVVRPTPSDQVIVVGDGQIARAPTATARRGSSV